MVDFTLMGIIEVLAQTFCGGSTQIAGLLVMMAVFLGMLVIFALVQAPMQYAVAPLIIVDIIFTALGIVNTTVSFIILIICAVMMARQVRDIVGGERWRCSVLVAAMTACKSSLPFSAL